MAAIEFDHVSKAYRLGTGGTSLREALASVPRKLFHRRSAKENGQPLWALNDVSFQVEQGEVLGIIGPNGAGKSTILKLLSKVTCPTRGHIRTRGRMAALIELGAGFHPDLTGRQNVYLNGTILGLTRRELDAQFPAIVEFAGLDRFIDTPIKRYSSGMYVRLAFAVAAYVRAELLLVDEVLSVGDMSFQQKSLAKMNELRDTGATIVFVSHNLAAVRVFCSRAILLNHGRIAAEGKVGDVIRTYEDLDQKAREVDLANLEVQDNVQSVQSLAEATGSSNTPLMPKVELLDSAGQPSYEFEYTEGLTVRCCYVIPNEMKNPVCEVQVRRRTDGLICFRLGMSHPVESGVQGEGVFEAHIDQLLLRAGLYTVYAKIYNYEWDDEAAVGLPAIFRISGRIRSETAGVYQPKAKWSFDLGDDGLHECYQDYD